MAHPNSCPALTWLKAPEGRTADLAQRIRTPALEFFSVIDGAGGKSPPIDKSEIIRDDHALGETDRELGSLRSRVAAIRLSEVTASPSSKPSVGVTTT